MICNHTSVGLVVAACVAASTSVAAAQGGGDVDREARAEAKALDAKFKFKARKFDAAARAFLEAYALSHKPALLYNAARAYEEAGSYAEAKVAFEQYLGLPQLGEGGRRDARAKVEEMARKIAATKRQPTTRPAPVPAPKPSPLPTRPARHAEKPTPAPHVLKPAPTPAPHVVKPERPHTLPGRPWITWALVAGTVALAGGAVAMQVTAVGEMNAANAMDFEVNNRSDPDQVDAKVEAYDTQASGAERMQAIAIATGVAAAGLGAWTIYRMLRSDRGATQRAVWIEPATMRGARSAAPGIVLGGRF